jgi:hypothetical protein
MLCIQTLDRISTKKRFVERPGLGWKYNIKIDLKDVDVMVGDEDTDRQPHIVNTEQLKYGLNKSKECFE